jgi:hypothetical protein
MLTMHRRLHWNLGMHELDGISVTLLSLEDDGEKKRKSGS